ncbi:MAG: type IV secretory system conjugative DNA transfer family protein, partial [Terriglobales bacterium]
MQHPPDSRALMEWLKCTLKTELALDDLLQTYDRVGRLLDLWHQLSTSDYMPEALRRQNINLLMDMAHTCVAGGLPLGVHAVNPQANGASARLPLSLSPAMRQANPHVLALGLMGKGKTCLLTRMIAHDIEAADRAVVVIDSAGTLIDFIDNWISNHPRCDDFVERTTILDPTLESGNPVFNPLEYPDDDDVQAVASAVVSAFRGVHGETDLASNGSDWNGHTATILRNAILLLIFSGSTLAHLPTLLLDADYRDLLLHNLAAQKSTRTEHRTLLEIWAQYKRLADAPQWITWIEPILTRITPLLSDGRVLSLLNSRTSTLDLHDVICNRRILLIKLPQAQLDHSGDLLAALMIASLKRAAVSLSSSDDTALQPCTLYADELDNLIGWEGLSSFLNEARKYQIGFTGSARSIQALPQLRRSHLLNLFGTIAAFAL